ncbi:MAG: asparagine synthase (glutamine-hydrolyzing) [Victivallales bacterium]|nr:asparagine synthase (glutamine-hydrolyzing) [Victivallales bacterium]
MCSIAGIIHPQSMTVAVQIAEAMNQTQFHRGPDGGGVWHDEQAVLAHRRLAIIDLDGGAQPMANEDGTLHLVFNGEIYNHIQLRKRLIQAGHLFRTSCDTEVLLHLYEEKGDNFVQDLDGMFAFALWDATRQKLLLGRDRAGQKPLHYFLKNGTLVFASELAALHRHPEFPVGLSETAVADFLSLQYVPSPHTIYREVHKLPPATLMRFFPDSGRVEQEKYWQLDFSQKCNMTFPEAKERLREVVIKSVRKRLMSDVPLGVFLSGGVDSAIIAAVVAKLCAPEKVQLFTIGFDEGRYDERGQARATSDWLRCHGCGNVEHFVKSFPGNDFGEIQRLLGHFGEPFADASMLPTLLLSRFARQKVTVALSGDGADELFGGYDRYLAIRLRRLSILPEKWQRWFFRKMAECLPDTGERTLAGRLRRLCGMLATNRSHAYFSILDRCPPQLKHDLAGERLRESENASRIFDLPFTAKDQVEQCLEADFRLYLENDILPKVDRTSMAASLEVRNPFLDRELVEFAATLPLSFKLHGTRKKYILRETFADCLPPAVFSGRKRGFGVPIGQLLRNEWRDSAREVLFARKFYEDGWLSRPAVEQLWNDHQNGLHDYSYILFNIIILSLFPESVNCK